jgi:hypothetical protein
MSDLEAIERAVASLPAKELAEFSAWFENYAAERFDEAIERDARSGALRRLVEEATRQFRGGVAKEL